MGNPFKCRMPTPPLVVFVVAGRSFARRWCYRIIQEQILPTSHLSSISHFQLWTSLTFWLGSSHQNSQQRLQFQRNPWDISFIDLHSVVDSSPQSHAWSGPGRPVLGDATFAGVGRWTTDFLLKYLDWKTSSLDREMIQIQGIKTGDGIVTLVEMTAPLKNLLFHSVYSVHLQ